MCKQVITGKKAIKKSIEHEKYDCNHSFTIKSNFGNKQPVRSWYTVKQMN